MAAIAFGVLGTAVGDHGADVAVFAAAELAAERAVRIPFERLMVAPVRIVQAAVRYERTEFRSLFPAVDADERSALGSLEKGVVAASGGMERARVVQEGSGVRVRPSAVFAVFAHGLTCFRVSPGRVPARGRVSRARTAAQAETPDRAQNEKSKGRANAGRMRLPVQDSQGRRDGRTGSPVQDSRGIGAGAGPAAEEKRIGECCTGRHHPPRP